MPTKKIRETEENEKNNYKRCQVYLTEEQHEYLRKKRYIVDETMSSFIRDLVEIEMQIVRKKEELLEQRKRKKEVKRDQIKERKLEMIYEVIDTLFGDEDS